MPRNSTPRTPAQTARALLTACTLQLFASGYALLMPWWSLHIRPSETDVAVILVLGVPLICFLASLYVGGSAMPSAGLALIWSLYSAAFIAMTATVFYLMMTTMRFQAPPM